MEGVRRSLGASRGEYFGSSRRRWRARAREAIVRIVDISSETEKISRVDVYAEGQILVSGTSNATQRSYRGELETSEVRLKCYDRAGPKTEKDPPWGLAIIRRSGFVGPKPVVRPERGHSRRSGAAQFVARNPRQ